MKFSVGTDYRFPAVVRHQGMVIVLACTEASGGDEPLRVLLHGEALFLSEDKAVTEASEDFPHLPYCAGQRDISRNTRNAISAPVSAQGSSH